MRKLTFLLACLFLIGLGLVNAQSKSISGKVISTEDGQPVIGASVMVKGTQTGTITGIDGSFTIAITGNSKTLTISYVGMKTIEVDVSKSQKLTVSLSPDVFGLNEVVVSGVAAETSKKKLAVSVTKVGEDDLEKVTASSAASALQGKVAGVTVTNSTGQPGDGATIIIRGATQIAGSQDPLIIVDGVLLKGTLADVNVDDIESMEVVKGASASALYGSQAGNGVIVVTTKRGKGLNVGQTSVTFRNEYGINRLSKEYNLATHHAYTLASDWENYSTYTKYDGVTYPSGYAGGYSDEISGSRSLDADHYMDNPYARTYDLQKEFFKGNNFYTNYISVQNKGEKSNTLASFENYKQNGIIFDDQGYSRHSFRINTDQRIKDNITLSASNLYVISSQKYPGDNGANKYNGGSFFNLLLTAPDVDLNMKNVDGQPYQFIPDPWEPTTENPLYSVYKIDNLLKRNRFLGSYNLSWNITPALKFTGDYAFEKSSEMYTEYKPYDTYERGSSGAQYSQGLYYKYASDDFSEKAQASFSYAKSIQDFNLRAKASYLYENRVFESFSATGYDFGVKDIPSFDAIGGTKTATSYQSQIVAENAFAILYADYKEKYIFDGMFRYDGSSLFGSEQRWQPYYRVSGAWRVTEDFKISGINEFKIRAALGTAGQRPPFSAQYEVMSVSNGVTSKYYKGNKDLKPSRTTEFEAGFDIDFLDKFSFSAVYSKANTADQFLNAPLASYANGWLYQWINAGTLASNTFEATLAAKIINSKDFKWSAGLTFDRSRNQITKLNIPAYQTGPEGQDANKLFYIKEGETLGTMYGYKFIRTMEQLNQQISFMDGTIDDYEVNSDGYVIKKGTAGTVDEKPIKLLDQDGNAAFVKIGDSNPDFKMGITTNLSYKDWSLYALFDWKQGGDVYNKTAQWLTRDSRNGIMDQYGKADSEKKTIDYYQAFYDTNDFNDYWVEDGSYLKLRELSISYSVNKKTLSKFASGFIQGVSLSVIGRNLFTLTKYSGYDPEVATSDTDGTQTYAYDFMGYPNFRSFSVSLELKF